MKRWPLYKPVWFVLFGIALFMLSPSTGHWDVFLYGKPVYWVMVIVNNAFFGAALGLILSAWTGYRRRKAGKDLS
jgi:hypothetical protein